MGRQIPTECLHGYVIDPGDFNAKVEECPHCDRAQNFSYDTRCAELADVFLSEEASALMSNEVYAGHAQRLAQEIQDCIETFCGYDAAWAKAKSSEGMELADRDKRIERETPDPTSCAPAELEQETDDD